MAYRWPHHPWGYDPATESLIARRLTPVMLTGALPSPAPPGCATVCIVDTETTGVDTVVASIIELATMTVAVCPDTGTVYRAPHAHDGASLSDPVVPIPPEVTRVTGITRDMVRGQTIADAAIEPLRDADYIVAHNAAFDWQMCTKKWPQLRGQRIWGCSMRQVDWPSHGMHSSRQEILARYHGYWYSAHRALADCESLAYLLSLRPDDDPARPTYMGELIAKMRESEYRVIALDSTFGMKDDLKRSGYRWDPAGRRWYTHCAASDRDAVIDALSAHYSRHGVRMPCIEALCSPVVSELRWDASG